MTNEEQFLQGLAALLQRGLAQVKAESPDGYAAANEVLAQGRATLRVTIDLQRPGEIVVGAGLRSLGGDEVAGLFTFTVNGDLPSIH